MPTMKLTEKSLERDWLGAGLRRVIIRDEELPGFIATVGRLRTTFAVDYRGPDRKRRLLTIGVHGRPMPSGREPWNVARARARARELLGQVAGGVDPGAPKRRLASERTLRDGLNAHLESLRKRRKSERSIETMEGDMRRHMSDWLDRPISQLTGAELARVHDAIKAKAKGRAGTGNAPGASLANRIVRHVSAIWRTLDRAEPLEGRNPATAVVRDHIEPRGSRIPDTGFVAWYADVQRLVPIRRDLQLLALLTGARSGSIRCVAWPDVDEEGELLTFEKAKGGKPYTVPLGPRALEILARRRKENAVEFEPFGGDHGFVFPSFERALDDKGRPVVCAVAESKEYRQKKGPDGKVIGKVRILPPIHDLRRTYNSVAIEIGIPPEARNMLLNHERRGVNVKHYGFPQNWEWLADCQRKIEAELWARLTAAPRAPRARRRPPSGGKGRGGRPS